MKQPVRRKHWMLKILALGRAHQFVGRLVLAVFLTIVAGVIRDQACSGYQNWSRQIARIKSAAVFVGSEVTGSWQEETIAALLREFVRRRCPVIPNLLANASRSHIYQCF